jgi:hypothetical protein
MSMPYTPERRRSKESFASNPEMMKRRLATQEAQAAAKAAARAPSAKH